MTIEQWDQYWKSIQTSVKKDFKIEQILNYWLESPPDKASLRMGWPSKSHKPEIRHLGYRKNSKLGAEASGEKGLELKLLGQRGKIKTHYIERGSESLKMQVFFHNMGLGTARNASQKIIDCFGIIHAGGNNYPAAVEVKKTDQNPWYAVIENLIQLQMLRENYDNLQKYFGNPPLSFGELSSPWGVVLAPKSYFTNSKNEDSLKRSLALIERLGEAPRLTLVSCGDEPTGVETSFEESAEPKDDYWKLSYEGGFWPSKAETLRLS